MGGPPHRRPEELRDADVVRDGHRPLPPPVRRRARGGRARPASGVPVDEARDGARRRRHDRRAASPRSPRGVPRRAWRGGSGRRRDLRRQRATARDGTVWGGELLVGGLADFERVGLLFPVRLPGGDAAVRQPWRMACAWLTAALGRAAGAPARSARKVSAHRLAPGGRAGRDGLASPVTTSAGRLFDAVAALCGVRARGELRGPGGVELEAAADPADPRAYPLPSRRSRSSSTRARRSARSSRDVERGVPLPSVSARFHNALARATAAACRTAAERAGTTTVVLSGGVFQNRTLLGSHARLAGGRRAARAGAGAPAAERRRHLVRAARCRERPAGRRGCRCSGLTTGSQTSLRAAALRSCSSWRCCSASARLRPGPSGRGIDPDRLRPRGRHAARGPARSLLGSGPCADAGPVRPADRAAPARTCPDALQATAEAAVGVVIMLLALRLLIRWRRGQYHAHPHSHGDVEHRHLHPHDQHRSVAGTPATSRTAHEHEHDPGARLGRTRWQAFGIGLVHGTGGFGRRERAAAGRDPRQDRGGGRAGRARRWDGRLDGTALLGVRLRDHPRPVLTRMLAFAPAMGVLTLAFGGWYTLGAIGAVPYAL